MDESLELPAGLPYDTMGSISNEERYILQHAQPATLAAANKYVARNTLTRVVDWCATLQDSRDKAINLVFLVAICQKDNKNNSTILISLSGPVSSFPI